MNYNEIEKEIMINQERTMFDYLMKDFQLVLHGILITNKQKKALEIICMEMEPSKVLDIVHMITDIKQQVAEKCNNSNSTWYVKGAVPFEYKEMTIEEFKEFKKAYEQEKESH